MEGLEERLRALSAEFGCEGLRQACDCLGQSGGAAVLGRLQKLEAKQAALERAIVHGSAEVRRDCDREREKARADRLEAEVVRLSGLCLAMEERISSLTRLFEGEQQYRRGCESLYGTNGFGEKGGYLSERLGFSQLKQSADSGHSDAQFQVGRCLLSGRGCSEDKADGRVYLERSASAGNSSAESEFGRCLQFGYGGAEDKALAAEYFRRSANRGNARGERYFGLILQFGRGVAEDPVRAVEYYERSAAQGNSWGRHNLAQCLMDGTGCAVDPARGASLMKLSADQGNSTAQNRYGLFLEGGNGVGVDRRMAAHYFKLAMHDGHKEAKAAYERSREYTPPLPLVRHFRRRIVDARG
jgi:TPR repeat protein